MPADHPGPRVSMAGDGVSLWGSPSASPVHSFNKRQHPPKCPQSRFLSRILACLFPYLYLNEWIENCSKYRVRDKESSLFPCQVCSDSLKGLSGPSVAAPQEVKKGWLTEVASVSEMDQTWPNTVLTCNTVVLHLLIIKSKVRCVPNSILSLSLFFFSSIFCIAKPWMMNPFRIYSNLLNVVTQELTARKATPVGKETRSHPAQRPPEGTPTLNLPLAWIFSSQICAKQAAEKAAALGLVS